MIDPICGMEVDPSNAAESYTYNGQTYHFCSHRCLTKFKEDPEKSLKGRANEHAAPAHEHAHVVHRLPKIRPSTGFLFVQWTLRSVRCNRDRAPSAVWRWTWRPLPLLRSRPNTFALCIRDRAPGARLLPICGMTLEPRTVTLQEETNPKLVVMTFSSVSVITNALRLNKLQL